MIASKLKSLFQINALKVTQGFFIIIPLIVMSVLYIFLSGGSIEQVFNEPILTVQFITLLTYPFYYLLIKSIRNNLENKKEIQLVPLWILTGCILMTFNVICTFLLIYGIYQEYGNDILNRKYLKINKNNISLIISLLPLIALNIFLIFIKFRLGMI